MVTRAGTKADTMKNLFLSKAVGEFVSHAEAAVAIDDKNMQNVKFCESDIVKRLRREEIYFVPFGDGIGYLHITKEEYDSGSGSLRRMPAIPSNVFHETRVEVKNQHSKTFTKEELMEWGIINLPDHASITISY